MFRVILRMEIRPGMGADFEATWTDVAGVIAAEPANLRQSLARSTDGSGDYFIISEWTSEPEFRRFECSEAHLHHRERLHPYRTGGQMWTMDVSVVSEGPASLAVAS